MKSNREFLKESGTWGGFAVSCLTFAEMAPTPTLKAISYIGAGFCGLMQIILKG